MQNVFLEEIKRNCEQAEEECGEWGAGREILMFLSVQLKILILYMYFFLRFYLFIFRERAREKETKHQCVVASCAPPTGELACNPGTCPDWESNWQPFVSQAGPQSTKPPARASV